MKNTFVYWTFLSKELIDIQIEIESLFDNLNLQRDYENNWEWLEGKTEDNIYDLNVSRKYNWKKGEYDKELVIIIKTDNQLNIDEFGVSLSTKLGSTIYYGFRNFSSGTEYDFEIIGEYK